MLETRRGPLVCGDPTDPVMQLFVDDLQALGHAPDINSEPELARHDQVIYCDQATFLAWALGFPLGRIPAVVVLRRPGLLVEAQRWATGINLISRMARHFGPQAIRLVALTPAAVHAVAMAGCPDVALLPLPTAGPPDRERDTRLAAEFDADTGMIRTARGLLPLDAQNWAQLRKRLRFQPESGPDGDVRDLLHRCNAGAMAGSGPQSGPGPTFVAVVTNGVGLGHLTRLLAISDELRAQARARVIFWCFSQGAGILVAAGYEVIQRATAQHLDCDYDDWIDWEEAAFSASLAEWRPQAVIYDSSGVDPFVTRALRRAGNGGTALVLVRRAMWQAHRDPALLEATQHAVLVVEPGDLSAAADRGPTVTAHPRLAGLARFATTAPVVLKPDGGPLPRAAARRALGLSRFRRRYCLVSLGGEAFGRDSTLARDIAAAAAKAGVGLIWARSPLARSAADLGIDRASLRHLYPLGRYLEAFDGLITACGYNSFHEAMQTGLPVLLAPTAHERLDDQVARASHATFMGWAQLLDPTQLGDRSALLGRFMADVRAGRLVSRPQINFDGASEMARLILAETGERIE